MTDEESALESMITQVYSGFQGFRPVLARLCADRQASRARVAELEAAGADPGVRAALLAALPGQSYKTTFGLADAARQLLSEYEARHQADISKAAQLQAQVKKLEALGAAALEDHVRGVSALEAQVLGQESELKYWRRECRRLELRLPVDADPQIPESIHREAVLVHQWMQSNQCGRLCSLEVDADTGGRRWSTTMCAPDAVCAAALRVHKWMDVNGVVVLCGLRRRIP
jgi:hypothetical protein